MRNHASTGFACGILLVVTGGLALLRANVRSGPPVEATLSAQVELRVQSRAWGVSIEHIRGIRILLLSPHLRDRSLLPSARQLRQHGVQSLDVLWAPQPIAEEWMAALERARLPIRTAYRGVDSSTAFEAFVFSPAYQLEWQEPSHFTLTTPAGKIRIESAEDRESPQAQTARAYVTWGEKKSIHILQDGSLRVE